MQSAQKPANTDRNEGGGVRLRLNLVPEPFVERRSRVTGRVGRLAVKVLRCAGGLIDDSIDLAFGIAGKAPKTFFDLAAEVFGSACYSVFIHDCIS
jgi:hypothetical protein